MEDHDNSGEDARHARPRATHKAQIIASERISEGWSPAQLHVAPDGGPVPMPAGALHVLQDADWICLKGPCRHYHRLVTTIDAQKPLPQRGENGSLESNMGDDAEPRATVHTCYPAPGVEMDMGDTVVYECNLWDPIVPELGGEDRARAMRREHYAELAEQEVEEMTAAATDGWVQHEDDNANCPLNDDRIADPRCTCPSLMVERPPRREPPPEVKRSFEEMMRPLRALGMRPVHDDRNGACPVNDPWPDQNPVCTCSGQPRSFESMYPESPRVYFKAEAVDSDNVWWVVARDRAHALNVLERDEGYAAERQILWWLLSEEEASNVTVSEWQKNTLRPDRIAELDNTADEHVRTVNLTDVKIGNYITFY